MIMGGVPNFPLIPDGILPEEIPAIPINKYRYHNCNFQPGKAILSRPQLYIFSSAPEKEKKKVGLREISPQP
ncbi:hypothetical protein CEXT_745491 [Caerostris extrusa]|uniref:Uncharacterized protein n=1 Tax=Caerostris extrusa TaxID=172846 RepID=A0AAV4RDM0_CAEEX|nr:hypothetical protein CEXT_745491 [Caerostris extrusa]